MTKTILFLAANPKNTQHLRLDEEAREIEDGLQRSKYRQMFKIRPQWAVRAKDIRRAMLDYRPQVVHFSGHSSKEGIILENDAGQPNVATGEALAGLFELFPEVECVLLNACYSETQSDVIVKHVDYVIGMNQEISDQAAIEFSVAFYDALGAGKSFEFAYKLGCNAIQLAGIPANLLPILRMRTEKDNHNYQSNDQEHKMYTSDQNSDITSPPGYAPVDEQNIEPEGTSKVCKAYCIKKDRYVALKFSDEKDAGGRLRLKREFNRLQTYDHPHIVSVLDYDEKYNPPYLAMEWLEGKTLHKYLKDKPPVSEIFSIFAQITDALAYIHSFGDKHRDLKPANIIVLKSSIDEGFPQVKLLDFGLVRSDESNIRITLTTPGILGSPAYMSPEQFKNPSIVDGRSDLYALGIMLYEALTGKLPFTGTSYEVQQKHLTELPMPPSQLSALITRDLEDVILRLLEKDRDKRFPSAEALLYRLQELSAETPLIDRARIDSYQPRLLQPPMQGREEELESLQSIYEHLPYNKGQMVLIQGEVGVGKSRLLAEYLDWLSRRKVTILHTATLSNPSVPFAHIIEILREAINQLEMLGLTFLAQFGSLYKLLPDLPEVLIHAFPPEGLPPKQEKTLLYDTICRFLEHVATPQPVVIVIDDLHRADPDTFELLLYMISRIKQEHAQILICASCCNEELNSPHLTQMLSDLKRQRLIHIIDLHPLSVRETEAMVTGMLGHPLPDLALLLHEKTEGNPLFIDTIIRSWAEQDRLVRQHGVWTWLNRELLLPSDVMDVFQLRLNKLDRESQKVLQIAAVIGAQFEFELLSDVAQKDEDTLLDMVDIWIRMSLVENENEPLTFKHNIIQEVCLRNIRVKHRRKQLHHRVAQAIEVRYKDDLGIYAEALANHYRVAEHPIDALRYATQAARYAHDRGAFSKTLQILEEYEKSITEDMNKLIQFGIYDSIGDAAENLGQHQKALDAYKRAYTLSSQISVQYIPAYQRAHVVRQIGRQYGWLGEIEQAYEWMQIGRSLIGRPDNHAEREALALLEIHTGFIAYQQGELERAERACQDGLNSLLPEDSNAVKGEGLLILGAAQDALGKYKEAQYAYEKSIAIWQELKNPYEVCRAENNLAALQLLLGNLTVASTIFQRLINFFEEISDDNRLVTSLTNLGIIYFRQGRHHDAEQYHRRAVQLADDIAIPWLQSLVRVNLAWVYLTDNRLNNAETYARKSIELETEHNLGQSIAEAYRILAYVAIEQGKFDLGLEHALKSLQYASDGGEKLEKGAAQRTIGRAYRKKQEFQLAEEYLERSLSILMELSNPFEIAQTYRQLAWLCQDIPRPTAAMEYAFKAVALFAKLGAEGELQSMQEDKRMVFQLEVHGAKAIQMSSELLTNAGWTEISTERLREGLWGQSFSVAQEQIVLRLTSSDKQNETIVRLVPP